MGLVIDLDRLDRVAGRENAPSEATTTGGPRNGRTAPNAIITEAVLAETRARYPQCRCEETGYLRAGMTLRDALREGTCTEVTHRWCTDPGTGARYWVGAGAGGVCVRVDRIRRRYGH